MTLNQIKAKRASLVATMRGLLNKAHSAGRDLNAEEIGSYDRYEAEVDRLTSQIAGTENHLTLSRGLSTETARPALWNGGRLPAGHHNHLHEFLNFVRTGKPDPLNALQIGTDSEGGFIVPTSFEAEIVRILTNGNPLRAASNVQVVFHDRNIPFEADTGSFGWIAEEAEYTQDDPVFARVTLGAHKLGGIVKVSEELFQDSVTDVQKYLADLAARRFINSEDAAFGNGDGSAKPLGLFQTTSIGGVSVTGFTGEVSAAAVITGDDIIDTFHSMKTQYRRNATWVMSDTMVKMVRKLKDSDEQYLWQPGLIEGQPDRLLGRPVIVSDGAPEPAPDAKSIVLADLTHFMIVDRPGIWVQRLNELYAANGQIGFKFHKRVDAKFLNPEAITYFTHGAAS